MDETDDAEPLVRAARPIRVAVLSSKGDVRLRHLLEADPNRGETYEFVGGVVNVEGSPAAELLAAHDVPTEVRDLHAFYEARDASLDDMDVRHEFDERVAEALATHTQTSWC